MGRPALTLRSRDGRAAFDPDRAPHRGLVRELVMAHLPPLHARLRGAIVDQLVRRIVTIEQSPVPLVEEPRAGQLAIVALRVQQAIRELETEERAVVRAFRAFSDLHATLDDPALRRRLLAEYLAEKVSDRRQLAGDLAALDRHLGYDALRERHLRVVLGMSAQVEEGLLFLAGAVAALIGDPGDGVLERVVEPRLVELCATRLVHGTRWQVRFAAGRALVAVAEALAGAVAPAALELIAQTAHNLEEHPWVQAAALEAGVLLDGDAGRSRLVERLTSPHPGKDLFVRGLAIRIATRRLPAEESAALIARLVEAGDPSEHVRMTLVEAAAELGWPAAEPHLAALGGLIRPREPSARVRATVAIATRRLAASAAAAADLDTARGAAGLLAAMTGGDLPFTLQTVCEELAALAGELAATAPTLLAELAPAWIEALDAVVADEATAPRIAEAAAGAAEAIDRERDPVRRQLTAALGEACAAIPPGGAGVVALGGLPDQLAAAARDDAQLGRVLADLTRRDWGVSATRRGDRLRLWRGDHFRRRLWRILHELRNPLPNKRQAWVHTVGRDYPGEVRAHPGLLDEATATTVPGERVTVDDEGSWCRHLPMVDDLLDLPVTRARPVRVVSSLGVSLVEPPAALWKRIRNRFAIAARYRTLAGLRLASLRAPRDRQRRRYIETLARDFDIKVQLLPHARPEGVAPLPPATAELFAEPATSPAPVVAAGASTALALAGPLGWLRDFLDVNRYYFESPTQNSQTALVAFGAALSGLFFTAGWAKRRRIDRARAAIPLTIGGWGTRGKSGTERLKAALFDGLGFEVFVKTTGCEAMFIHSAPMQQPVEIFIYRPYDKATIWEQRAMLELGARLRTDVFLWECMALNPKYVQLLQHDWMRDDLVTLTNCYPDHEDIQGPAGFNVAQVITEFIPTRSVLVTSETSYLPMFAEVARQRGTTMYTIGERDAELIPDDVLDLYPYREHPRNIALVTRVTAELGLERDLAWLTMAEYVVPDLGVLKSYPKVRVRGRLLTFVCGNSANERTGFINNWRRIKLDRLDLAREPHRLVITVVNNRADRISRSEVFARILVRDVAFDRHVLIGTNLKGLRGFIDVALDDYLRELNLVEAEELAAGEVPVTVATRLVRELGKLRIPPATAEGALVRLGVFAGGAGRRISPEAWPALAEALAARLDGDPAGALDVHAVRTALTRDRELASRLDAALLPITDGDGDDEHPETLEPATVADAIEHFVADLARMVVRGRLEARLRRLFEQPGEPARRAFAADFASAYRTMFLAQVEVIDDAGASGDQIIDRCARCVPPGTDVTLMGTQNIKGTGLDFVYRWLAVDKVVTCLREQSSQRLDRRSAALAELEGFEDHGLVDAGLARALLARPAPHPPTSDEEAARQRLKTRVEQIWQKRRKGLVEARRSGLLDRVAAWGEGWLDWADSVRRTHQARQITDDLVAHRISHGRASVEMRKLVGRLKGGWLAKALRRSAT